MRKVQGSRVVAPLYALPFAWRASRWPLFGLSGVLLLQGLLPPFAALLLGRTVDYVASGVGLGDATGTLIVPWCAWILASVATQPAVFSLSGRVNEDLSLYLQELLLHKGQSLRTLALFDDVETYDAMSRIMREVKSRPSNYVVLYVYILRSSISIVGYIGVVAVASWLAPIIVILSAVPLTMATTAMREANWLAIRSRTGAARFVEYLASMYLDRRHFWDLRTNSVEGFATSSFENESRDLLRDLRAGRRAGIARNLPLVAAGAVGYLVAIWILLRGAASVGVGTAAITSAIQGYMSLQSSANELVENISFLNEKAFFFRDLKQFLESSEWSECAENGVRAELTGDVGTDAPIVEFRDVSFRYPGADSLALDHISFSVRGGNRVAIVGRNGAGKSTLLKVLAGMCFPAEGSVLVGGQSLTRESLEGWRRHLSVVPQDPSVFPFSITENVTFGAGCPAKELMDEYLGVGARSWGDGRLTAEFGGRELSGGERQRLSLVRALYRDRDVFVLDEPTSAIDPLFEASMFDALSVATEDKTVITVTHRLPQALAADLVVVLDRGRVAEMGTPEDLLRRESMFSEMVAEQRRLLRG